MPPESNLSDEFILNVEQISYNILKRLLLTITN